MATTPNVGLDLPDEEKTVADEVRRLAANLVLLDGLIKSLQTLVGQKAATGHTHTLAQISGLVDALASKMPQDRQFTLADLVDVIGSVNAPAGYIFVKRTDGKFEFVSSAAAIGTHKHVVTDIIDFDEKVGAKIATLTGNAPAALDTLYELAAAIGNDPNIRQTLLNAIAEKFNKTGGTLSGPLSVETDNALVRLKASNGRTYYLQSQANGRLRIVDETGNAEVLSIGPDGDISTKQLGDLNTRIENRSYAWRSDAIANIMPTIAAQGVGAVGTTANLFYDGGISPGSVVSGGSLSWSGNNNVGPVVGYGNWLCCGWTSGRGVTQYRRIS